MPPEPRVTWRCFPWDSSAPAGAPFSAPYLVPGQTIGRFDLGDRPPVRYLAESPEHAIGEVLAAFRGTDFRMSYLRQSGYPLALVEVHLSPSVVARIVDCLDPHVLAHHKIGPNVLAHHDRTQTQAIARRIHTSSPEAAGLRWWSALTGAWLTNVVFTDREREGDLVYRSPRELRLGDPELTRALNVLGIRVRG